MWFTAEYGCVLPKKMIECRTGGPMADVARLGFRRQILISQLQQDIKIDLFAPKVCRSLERERVPSLVRTGSRMWARVGAHASMGLQFGGQKNEKAESNQTGWDWQQSEEKIGDTD